MSRHLTALPLLLLSTAAVAQTATDQAQASDAAPAPDPAAQSQASDVIVTAVRLPTPLSQVASSVTVLDKADIDRLQDASVADLLVRTPGVSLSRNGGYGSATTLRIRGAEGDQTLLVVDGVRLNDPSQPDGSYDFGNLLVGDASRIEVLRGPQAVLWGSQAVGGVVNVVTPLPTRPLEGTFDVEAGSRQTADARAGLAGVDGPLAWRVAAQTFTTRGISAVDDQFGGREPDGFRQQNVQGRAVLTLAPGVSADVRGYWSHGDTDFDGFGVDDDEFALTTQFVGYAGLNVDLLDGKWRNRIDYQHTTVDRRDENPDASTEQNFAGAGRNRRFEYQGSLGVAAGTTLQFGVENERTSYRTVEGPYYDGDVAVAATATSDRTGGYAELSAEPVHGLVLTGGLRHDANSTYGGRTVFEGGGVWTLGSGTTVRARYGEGFKVPSLYQLYSDYGNTTLRPELSHGWEAGLEQQLFRGGLTLGATYFDRRTRDLIGFESCETGTADPLCVAPNAPGVPRYGYYYNDQRAIAHGVEAAAMAKLGDRLTLDGNYSLTIAEDRTPGTTDGLWLPRRPRHEGNVEATYVWAFGLSTGVSLRWAGRSYDDAANTTLLDGYELVDLRAELPVGKTVSVFARAENLFDEQYETAYGYGTLGRSVYAGLRGRF